MAIVNRKKHGNLNKLLCVVFKTVELIIYKIVSGYFHKNILRRMF